MAENEKTSDIASLTVELLSAYLSNNTVPSVELAELIRSTRAALTSDAAPAEAGVELPNVTPAVSVRKSLASPDHIVSLIDGKPYKTLKRHLTTHGLTPETYRERYGLPSGYPMVAPAFATLRREIAQKIGLGSRRTRGAAIANEPTSGTDDVAADSAPEATVTAAPPKQRAKADAAKARKAPARKAKATVEPAAGPVTADVAGEVEPQADASTNATRIAAPAETQKPAPATGSPKARKQPTKRMARTPKASVKPAASDDGSEQTSAQTTETSANQGLPKRRGKLSLFGKEAAPPAAEVSNPKARWKRPDLKSD